MEESPHCMFSVPFKTANKTAENYCGALYKKAPFPVVSITLRPPDQLLTCIKVIFSADL